MASLPSLAFGLAIPFAALAAGPARGEHPPPELAPSVHGLTALIQPDRPLGIWHTDPDGAARLGLWGDRPAGPTPTLALHPGGLFVAYVDDEGGDVVGFARWTRYAGDPLALRWFVDGQLVEQRLRVGAGDGALSVRPPDGPPVTLVRGWPDERPWRPGDASRPLGFSLDYECRVALANRYTLTDLEGAPAGTLRIEQDGALIAEVGEWTARGAIRLEVCHRDLLVSSMYRLDDETLAAACAREAAPDALGARDAPDLYDPEAIDAVEAKLQGVVSSGEGERRPQLQFKAVAVESRHPDGRGGQERVIFRSPPDHGRPHVCVSETEVTLYAGFGSPCARPLRIGAPLYAVQTPLGALLEHRPSCEALPVNLAPQPTLAPLAGYWMPDRRASSGLAMAAVDTLARRPDPRGRRGFPGSAEVPGLPLVDGTDRLEIGPRVVGWYLDPRGVGWLVDAIEWSGGAHDATLSATPSLWSARSGAPDFVWTLTPHPDGGQTLRLAAASTKQAMLEGRIWLDGDHLTLTTLIDGARWLWRLQRAGETRLLDRPEPLATAPIRPPSGPGQPPLVALHAATATRRWRVDRAATAGSKGDPSSVPAFAPVLDDPRSAGHPLEFRLDDEVMIVRAGPVRQVSLVRRLRSDRAGDHFELLTIVDNQPVHGTLRMLHDDGTPIGGRPPTRARLFIDATEVAVIDAVATQAPERGF